MDNSLSAPHSSEPCKKRPSTPISGERFIKKTCQKVEPISRYALVHPWFQSKVGELFYRKHVAACLKTRTCIHEPAVDGESFPSRARVYAVVDGPRNGGAAIELSKTLKEFVLTAIRCEFHRGDSGDVQRALRVAFASMTSLVQRVVEEEVCGSSSFACGARCTVCVVDVATRRIWCANVGDCPALLIERSATAEGKNAVKKLYTDHTCFNRTEREVALEHARAIDPDMTDEKLFDGPDFFGSVEAPMDITRSIGSFSNPHVRSEPSFSVASYEPGRHILAVATAGFDYECCGSILAETCSGAADLILAVRKNEIAREFYPRPDVAIVAVDL